MLVVQADSSGRMVEALRLVNEIKDRLPKTVTVEKPLPEEGDHITKFSQTWTQTGGTAQAGWQKFVTQIKA